MQKFYLQSSLQRKTSFVPNFSTILVNTRTPIIHYPSSNALTNEISIPN